MSLYKELSYQKNEIEKVKGVQFCLLSPDEIVRRSVCEVTTTEMFNLNEPADNGLFDTRMGVLDHNHVCKTCEQKNTFCPGHFGHINLAKPVFFPQFFDVVRKTLNCVCFRCSRLLVDIHNPDIRAILNKKISRQKRFDLMYKVCSKVQRCGAKTTDGCGAKQPDKIAKDKDGVFRIMMEWKNLQSTSEDGVANVSANKQVLNAEDVLRILRRISDVDAEAMGFCNKYNRPEWMICTVLPVPPPAVRPSVRNDAGQRSEDDLTHKLSSIVKINLALKAKIDKNATKEQYDMWTQVLQYDVATLIDNNIPGLPPSHQRTGRPIKSLSERLKGKEGRIRGNLMGKRVDFSARSVITPDPNISIEELGVPIKIAMNLTFPEIVNDVTMKELQKLVRAGPDVYPGAKYVIKTHDDNRKIRLRGVDRERIASELRHGDVVERHLRDGDYVLFNRQPSLHKMSMMAHKIKVMPYNTFRLNVCVTPSFNADFDGDEMNAHVPQSLQTQQELINLAAVPQQIMSPRDSVPIVSIVQDIALGVYRLTKSHVRLHEKQMFNILAPIVDGIKPIPQAGVGNGRNMQRWTGRQVLSTIIPPNINVSSANKFFDERKDDDRENYVIIENGEIKQGTIDKSIYQSRSKGLVHSIYNEYSPEDTRKFFDNTQQLICNWLVYSGFSTGISDLVVDENTLSKCDDIIEQMKVKVGDFITKVHTGGLDNKSTKNNSDFFEQEVNNLLNNAAKKVGELAASQVDDKLNRMINMIKSGAKGSEINFAQMIGCLGQQNVDGERIPYGFDDRTLPHFTKYDDGAEARGFVQNSFISGLTPQEFFFHAMGGREGLIDTAVKTSSTGYIQRQLVKAMEDCKVHQDFTVRNATGAIVQFLYGEDGMDAVKIEAQGVPYVSWDLVKLAEEYLVRDKSVFKGVLRSEIFDKLVEEQVVVRFAKHFDDIIADRKYIIEEVNKGGNSGSVSYPVNIQRMIVGVQNMYKKYGGQAFMDLSPIHVLDTLDRLCSTLYVTKNVGVAQSLKMLLRAHLSPKVIIVKHRMCKAAFDLLVQQITQRFYDSIAHPGDMVGVVAAQSVGEPTTQLTLNTFHSAGISSASKAVRGVPRLQELLSVTKKIKTPIMTIHVKPEYRLSSKNKEEYKAKCLQVLNELSTTRFRDIVSRSRVYYDPDDFNTRIAEDKSFIELYREFNEVVDKPSDVSPWLLRLEFNRQKMVNIGINMIDIHNVFMDFYDDRISCMFSDDNSGDLVMRIKLVSDGSESGEDMLSEIKALEYNVMNNVMIKGIPGIEKISMREQKSQYHSYNRDTGMFEQINEWIMDTDGSNLRDIMNNKHVDPYLTTTNNINEIYEVLGIEAVRKALYNEIMEVLSGIAVNYRHISLLIDTMTNKGTIMPINRHGINRGDAGPLAKCSFEEVTDMLVSAGVFAEMDKINGVSANVMLGQIAPCGTGDSDVLLDEAIMKDIIASGSPSKKRAVMTGLDEDEELASEIAAAGMCTAEMVQINVPAPRLQQTSIASKKMNITFT